MGQQGQTSAAPAVETAARILSLLRDRSPRWLTMAEITRGVGSNKASVHRILATLQACKHVLRDPAGLTYALGPALIELGAAAAGEGPVLEVVRRVLTELADATGMSAEALRLAPDGQMICVAGCTGPGPFALNRAVGSSFRLSPAYGVLQYAWCGDAALTRLRETMGSGGENRDDPDFAGDVARARAQGFVWSIATGGALQANLAEAERWMEAAAGLGHGRASAAGRRALLDQFMGFSRSTDDTRSPSRLSPLPVLGVAAPVFDPQGEPALQLCVVSLLAQSPPSALAEIGRTVVAKADEVTAAIGGRRRA